jgi:hypothetical protein
MVALLQCSALQGTSNTSSVLRMPVCLACLVWLPGYLQWVADQNDNTASPMYGLADVGRMAVGGHSRGGKLAALAFTSEKQEGQLAGPAFNAVGTAVSCVCVKQQVVPLSGADAMLPLMPGCPCACCRGPLCCRPP